MLLLHQFQIYLLFQINMLQRLVEDEALLQQEVLGLLLISRLCGIPIYVQSSVSLFVSYSLCLQHLSGGSTELIDGLLTYYRHCKSFRRRFRTGH